MHAKDGGGRTDGRIDGACAEEVQCEFCLRYKMVPQMKWEGLVTSYQGCCEMCLSCLYGLLGCIAAVLVWWGKLKVYFAVGKILFQLFW